MSKENNKSDINKDYILHHYGFYKMTVEYNELKTLENKKDYMKHLTEWYMKEKAALSYADIKAVCS